MLPASLTAWVWTRVKHARVALIVACWCLGTGIAVTVDSATGGALGLTHAPTGPIAALVDIGGSLLMAGGLSVIGGRMWWGKNLRTAYTLEQVGWIWTIGGASVYAGMRVWDTPHDIPAWCWGLAVLAICATELVHLHAATRRAEAIQHAIECEDEGGCVCSG